jgi:hypothetical protein
MPAKQVNPLSSAYLQYFNAFLQDAAAAKADLAQREAELVQLKKKHDIGDD